MLPWLLITGGCVVAFVGGHLLLARTTRKESLHPIVEAAPSLEELDGESPFLMPIEGARIPTNPALLPGASRAYRGGQHAGVDFSDHPGTDVVAIADGWVLSVEDGPTLSEARRIEVLGYCTQLRLTPPEVLSVLHGRRVTLCHGIHDGRLLTTSYSHLGSVSPDLRPGNHVGKGEVIGETGASGTSHEFHDSKWSELHFEIHLNGVPLGTGLPPLLAGQHYREFFRQEAAR